MIIHTAVFGKWSSFYFCYFFYQGIAEDFILKWPILPLVQQAANLRLKFCSFCFDFLYIEFDISLCILSDISEWFEGAWLSTGGLYTMCPAADCRLWLALKTVPRIKAIQPVLCSINKYCPSSSPKGYRNDLVETCWLSWVSYLSNSSIVGLLLQHLAYPTVHF